MDIYVMGKDRNNLRRKNHPCNKLKFKGLGSFQRKHYSSNLQRKSMLFPFRPQIYNKKIYRN
jgi:hypothetical protein